MYLAKKDESASWFDYCSTCTLLAQARDPILLCHLGTLWKDLAFAGSSSEVATIPVARHIASSSIARRIQMLEADGPFPRACKCNIGHWLRT